MDLENRQVSFWRTNLTTMESRLSELQKNKTIMIKQLKNTVSKTPVRSEAKSSLR